MESKERQQSEEQNNKKEIRLSDHFTYGRILRFVFPTIVMMIMASVYSVVDGFFVSNYVGKVPFAAINLVTPILFILGSVGYMAGAGGSAIVAITLGEGKQELAEKYFTLITLFTAFTGLVLGLLGSVLVEPLAAFMGAEGQILVDCSFYGRTILLVLPCFMLSNMFQSFLITAGKPKLGLYMSMFSGLLNIFLDAVFIVGLHWGLAGAAFATALSQSAGAVAETLYFLMNKDSLLRFRRPDFEAGILIRTCTNGSSEMVNSIASSVITILFNYQLMRYAGAEGVAAYGVIIYAGYLFSSFYYGYAAGVSPVFSFHYGAGDSPELKSLFGKSLRIVGASGLIMVALVRILGGPIAGIFVGYDAGLLALTTHVFYIYSLSFLLGGFSAFASALFTALGNGKISALISCLKTFGFETVSILLLPALFGIDGIWWAIVAAEAAALALAVWFLVREREKYQYF